MKIIIIGFILLGTVSTQAQEVLDTIYANDQKNVVLFFPNPIRQGITGEKKNNILDCYRPSQERTVTY